MKKGEKYTVEITDTTHLGTGFAKVDGLSVFVEGAVTGEVSEILVTDVKKNYASAVSVRTVSPSPYRCDPTCPSYEKCGGCALRHVPYEYEGKLKRDAVVSAFRKVGLSPEIADTVLPSPVSYRNKATFHYDGNSVGFYSEKSSCVVPVSECDIVPKEFCDIARSALGTGVEKLTARISTKGEVHVTLAGKTEFVPRGVTGVTLDTGKDEFELISGERYVTSTLAGLDFRISPEAFFQVNYEGAEELIRLVGEFAAGCNFSSCADLFCGTGTLGMTLASKYPEKEFVGIEINPRSVEDAKFNAALNGIGNETFICADAASVDVPFELALVDPPRRGMSPEMISALLRFAPENVIYVSCNPFTLARDAKLLTEAGYEVKRAVPVNMFPRTSHVETVVLMSRDKE